MGNVTGRKDEAEASGTKKNIEEEEQQYMEYYGHTHGAGANLGGYDQVHARLPETMMVQSPSHSPRAHHHRSPFIFSSQRQSDDDQYEDMNTGNGIATIITWNYGGNQVAIEGSWDNWRTRQLLQKTGKEFTLVKVLPSGVYHYRFVADGHYRYDPYLPYEGDDRGNVFNVLDLQEQDQEAEIMEENIGMNEEAAAPSSPLSSYKSIPFSLEDFNEKLPDLPPLLRKTPLERSSATLKKPLHAILNHLYIQTDDHESMVALASTHRFRRKFVTTILYKSSKNPKM